MSVLLKSKRPHYQISSWHPSKISDVCFPGGIWDQTSRILKIVQDECLWLWFILLGKKMYYFDLFLFLSILSWNSFTLKQRIVCMWTVHMHSSRCLSSMHHAVMFWTSFYACVCVCVILTEAWWRRVSDFVILECLAPEAPPWQAYDALPVKVVGGCVWGEEKEEVGWGRVGWGTG